MTMSNWARLRRLGIRRRQVRYLNLTFMNELIAPILRQEPAERLTIDKAVENLRQRTSKLSHWELRARLVERDGDKFVTFFKNVYHVLFRTISHLVQRTPPLPTPRPGTWD
ncbi:hypothetical protein OH76DRAFT_845808 [Lentinus brumalis]|uniref:Protein kinase domain-containing protein n=1 Tax=Lentinus brumalis TaxID=2498619 RepID=A0A371DQP2_9APHY|nr:hypothetical protein OH76DRAFT_845808 [Polyporus brumalis]